MLDGLGDELGDLSSHDCVNLVVDLLSWGSGGDGGLLVDKLVLNSDVASAVAFAFSSSAALTELFVTVLLEALVAGTVKIEIVSAILSSSGLR